MVEAIVLGGLAGAVVESGKRGLVRSWREANGLPPLIKAAVVAILLVIPAIGAGSWSDHAVAALATVGAFTVARWSVASLIVLGRR